MPSIRPKCWRPFSSSGSVKAMSPTTRASPAKLISCASKVGREFSKTPSESGRAILLYEVGPGETCVLTTTCLMAGSSFPAESTAESDVLLGALPATVFHWLIKSSMQFVFGNYGELLSSWQSMRSCETF